MLIQALRYTSDDLKMPPDKKLPDAVIADFKRSGRGGLLAEKRKSDRCSKSSPDSLGV